MANLQVPCTLLRHGAGLPKQGLPRHQSVLASGSDLRAALRSSVHNGVLHIPPGCFVEVPTALQIALPAGYEGQVRPRSGLAAKYGLTVLNSPGTIDADYRGEIIVLLINHGKDIFTVQHGDRIAQLVIAPVSQVEFQSVEQLGDTERGAGGFGSSGLV